MWNHKVLCVAVTAVCVALVACAGGGDSEDAVTDNNGANNGTNNGANNGANDVQRCLDTCTRVAMCQELEAACGAEVVDGFRATCIDVCENDVDGRTRVLAGADLPCGTVVPLVIDGFSLVCDSRCDNACAAPADSCEDAVAVSYSGAGNCVGDDACDYAAVETRIDCGELGQECADGKCVEDACDAIRCDARAPFCDGDFAVSDAGSADCQDGVCDYSGVEMRVDCSDSGSVCRGGTCVDLCAGVECGQPRDRCDENTVLTFTGEGVCDRQTGECDYFGVTTQMTCAGDLVCHDAACVADDDPTVRPGYVIVNEIMADPMDVPDSDGEWFELRNATNRTLHLNNLAVGDTGRDIFQIDGDGPIVLAPRAVFVVGNNADMATNGGVAVDHVWEGFTLANGDDEVILQVDDLEIDRVEYDSDAEWPRLEGASIQFGGQYDGRFIENNDPLRWCVAFPPIQGEDGDRGTPGRANSPCPGPRTVTIDQLSNQDREDHPVPHTPVTIEGIVITAVGPDGELFAQDPVGGVYSGIFLNDRDVDVSEVAVGDLVDVRGRYVEEFGLVQVDLTSITVVGQAAVPAPVVVTPAQIASEGFGERYEAMLVRVERVTCTDPNPDDEEFGEFAIDEGVRVDDLLYSVTPDPVMGTTFESITGVLNFSFGAFKLEPRSADDVVGQVQP